MKTTILSAGFSFLLFACNPQAQQEGKPETKAASMAAEHKLDQPMEKQNIYQFKVQDLEGQAFDFATLRGKKVMIVNTASECGLTPQYKDLQAIYDRYKKKDFVIVGFPANNFGEQEPGSNQQIAVFCERNYGVTFPMMEKISVKGSDQHPVYQYLTQKDKNGLQDSEVEWNFQKYLINEQGELFKVIPPKVLPTDQQITSWIES